MIPCPKVFYIFFLLTAVVTCARLTAEPPPGYVLTWADEFDGKAVNEDEWTYREGANEPYYVSRKENISLKDGSMRIAANKEQYKHYSLTGGGLITKKMYHYGYYETRVKMDCGIGWHEAFWTCNVGGNTKDFKEQIKQPRIEIDCFEHSRGFDAHQFTYGIIEWAPYRGNLNREYHRSEIDYSKDFQIFSFEFTPDYFNFFLNGKVISTVDISSVTHNKFYIWLSCIATKPQVDNSGEVFFDYLRCYSIDYKSAEYQKRKNEYTALLVKDDKTQSSGVDLWIEAEDFFKIGAWQFERHQDAITLRGHLRKNPVRNAEDLTAFTSVMVATEGTYKAWVRTVDYEKGNGSGTRKCKISINGEDSGKEYGKHGTPGLDWEEIGTYNLKAGMLEIKLLDLDNAVKVDKLLLTTDLSFVPKGKGGHKNTEHRLQ